MNNLSLVRATFRGSSGHELASAHRSAAGPIRAFALFAHCFTCTKDVLAAKRIAAGLAEAGVGVLRFDFTGLGSSEGEFANTNFSSNVADLVYAAGYLRKAYGAPAILIGHSLGGQPFWPRRPIFRRPGRGDNRRPADVGHVLRQLGGSLDEIRSKGEAQVTLAGRSFNIRRSFVEDVEQQRLETRIRSLGKALLVVHAPLDEVVGIENASKIFLAAKHPKSFVSLDDADHMLTSAESAAYAAQVIVAWASRYIPAMPIDLARADHVLVRETERAGSRTLSLPAGIVFWQTSPLQLVVKIPGQILMTISRLRSAPAPP